MTAPWAKTLSVLRVMRPLLMRTNTLHALRSTCGARRGRAARTGRLRIGGGKKAGTEVPAESGRKGWRIQKGISTPSVGSPPASAAVASMGAWASAAGASLPLGLS